MKSSLFILIEKLLFKNIISFNKDELQLQVQSHPSYPSLHAITGVLDHFGIENMAFDLPQTKEVYMELPDFFIAHLKTKNNEELVFVSKHNKTVSITYPNNKKEKISVTDFLKQWSGIVVVVEKEELVKNEQIDTSKFKLLPFIILGLDSAFLLLQSHSFLGFKSLQLLLSLVGVYVAYLLVKHDLGLHSETVEKLCTQSKKTSCDAVLNSKAASVFGMFKLSDFSFVYFISLGVLWFVSSINNTSYSILTLLSYASLPVVAYSIYYQAFVVNKWCPLCLATATVLLSQAFIFFIYPLPISLKVTDFQLPLVILSLVVVIYQEIKPLISKNLTLRNKEVEYYKFKRNYSLFSTLHHQEPIINTHINSIQEITFGNPKASLEMVLITNPLCGFCKAKHQAVDKLLKTNKDDVKVIIRFNINTANSEDMAYKISTALINIYQQDKTLCKKALNQIYANEVDVKKWLNTYKVYTQESQQSILHTEKEWCTVNNINFTPAVYLNNRIYPAAYELNDLTLFIDDLKEQNESITESNYSLENI